ncbi:MAG: hypothetical protein ACE5EL_05650, partial [Anaerolineae bacterium]
MTEVPRLILGTTEGLVALELAGRGWRRGIVVWRGGDVTSLAVDASRRQRIVATFDSGTVASWDGGRTWTATDDAGTSTAMGARPGLDNSTPGGRPRGCGASCGASLPLSPTVAPCTPAPRKGFSGPRMGGSSGPGPGPDWGPRVWPPLP